MVFPQVNPDGRHFSMERYPRWRKNRGRHRRTPGRTSDPTASALRRLLACCRRSSRNGTRDPTPSNSMPPIVWLVAEEFEGPRYQRIGHIPRLMADGVVGPDLRHRREFARAPQTAE